MLLGRVAPFRLCSKAPPLNRGYATKLSYVKGGHSPPLLEDTIGSCWKKSVFKYSTKELLYNGETDKRFTWRDIDEQANAFARGLVSLGFERGDRLGVWMPNTTEWLVSQIACAKVGLILVNINPAYRLSELEYTLNLVGVKGLVFTPRVKSSDYGSLLQELIPELDKHSTHITGVAQFENIMRESGDMLDETLNASDAINIQFTSGTTGHPKGATLTHMGTLNNGYFVGYNQNTTEDDVLLVQVPLYHCFGCVLAIPLGAKLVYPSYTFNVKKSLEAIEKERCTSIYGVPTMFNALLNDPNASNTDFSSVRKGISAGSNAPPEIMRRMIGILGMREASIGYGMTETSPISFLTRLEDSEDDRCNTVGTILQHLEAILFRPLYFDALQAKVVDNEGNTVPRNTPGELMTKGYSVMKGYWGSEKQTKESIVDGWMKTGDVGIIDERGFCKVVGRHKVGTQSLLPDSQDMVIRGGENIYPREIEDFLFAHPNIVDIQVVGVYDEKYGEELCACVIPRIVLRSENDENEFTQAVQAYCKEKISHFKIPKYFMYMEKFPLTATGKTQKFLLKQMAEEKFDLVFAK